VTRSRGDAQPSRGSSRPLTSKPRPLTSPWAIPSLRLRHPAHPPDLIHAEEHDS